MMIKNVLRYLLAIAIGLLATAAHGESRDCTGLAYAKIVRIFQEMNATNQDSIIKIVGCNPSLIRGSSDDIKQFIALLSTVIGLNQLKQPVIAHINGKNAGYTFATVAEQGTVHGRFVNKNNVLFLYVCAYHAHDPYQLAEVVRKKLQASTAHIEVAVRR